MNFCYICGAVGYEELLATCVKCKSFFRHAYCMKIVQFDLKEDWICEDCHEPPKQVARKFRDEVLMLKRPVKLIPTDEAIKLAATQSTPTNVKRYLASPEKSAKKVEIFKKRREDLRNMAPPATSQRNYDLRACYPGGDPCKDPLRASKNAGKQRQSDEEMTIDIKLPNHPSSLAIWKGSFRISGFAAQVSPSCNVVCGYPPENVGRKAYEFSKTMPDALHFDEAIPRCTVWAKLFNGGRPDKYDIGLYFMPVGDRSERGYSCLVSHLEKLDVVLKTCISGIQLLIFSSSHLDEKSQKINQAYYLCGLFVPAVITLNEPRKSKNEEMVEMEIDMVGGAPVGKIDVPVPRDSGFCCCTMSKAGSSAVQPISMVQVKTESSDSNNLAASATSLEPRVPPGFEENGRLKYKTIAELLQAGDGKKN